MFVLPAASVASPAAISAVMLLLVVELIVSV